jgi:hypothetical protein
MNENGEDQRKSCTESGLKMDTSSARHRSTIFFIPCKPRNKQNNQGLIKRSYINKLIIVSISNDKAVQVDSSFINLYHF